MHKELRDVNKNLSQKRDTASNIVVEEVQGP